MTKKIQPQDQFILAEQVPQANVILAYPVFNSLLVGLKKIIKTSHSQILGIRQGRKLTYYFGQKESYTLAIFALDFILQNPKFGFEIDDKIVKYSDDLVARSKKANQRDIKNLSNSQLAKIISTWNITFQKLWAYGYVPNIIDTWYPEFTQRLKSYLRTKTKPEVQVNELFAILTTAFGRTEISQEFFELLQIASKIKVDQKAQRLFSQSKPPKFSHLFARFQKIILSHNRKHCHLEYLEARKKIPLERHLGFIHQITRQNINPEQKIKEILAQEKRVKLKKQKAIKKYAINTKYRQLFNLFGRFTLSKTKRKLSLARSMILLKPVFAEIAGRFGITWSLLNEMTAQEIVNALRGKVRVSKSILEKRKRAYVYYGNARKYEFIINQARMKKYKQMVKEDLPKKNIRELKGQSAFPGKVKGVVRKLYSQDDVRKVKKGDILVVNTTNPDMVPAMRRAAAIVTDMGGVTSHAAIVARELKVPCITGTKFSMKILKDGDLVEVDANKGVVKKL